MNRPIVRLYGLVVLLFAVLVGFTSRWTVFEASSLRANKLNARGALEQERIDRGPIVAADGSVLAQSVPSSEGRYRRIYPKGRAFAPVTGFYGDTLGSTGLEGERERDLTGTNVSSLQRIIDQLQGKQQKGDRVVTTLNPAAQRVADEQLAEHQGAIVALEPRSGAVTVMASSPTFDPNTAATGRPQSPGSSFVNRALQFGYAPGSTFKVLTATAAIDTGAYTPESTVEGRSGILVSGFPLANDNNASYGQISLTKALALSVNTVWAQVAERLGKATLARYMARFGFDRVPALDYPAREMSASGEYRNERLLAPTSTYVDVGRLGIGQDKLAVTPLQMAEVAAAVADGGRLMTPHLTSRVVNSEGQTVRSVAPHLQSMVMKPSTASAVTGMMEAVLTEGTAAGLGIPGVRIAGKTGTAETQLGTAINNVWFIAFAPARDPRVALAVTLAHVPGQGATFAAPVAIRVLESLLR